jgi:hypothetical protein
VSLTDRIEGLRTLALLDPTCGPLEVAIVDMLEELAEAVDALRGREQGLGSI